MKIALASCAKLQQADTQPAWKEIQAERPDVLLLLGDTIYLEHDHHVDPKKLQAELARLYAAQFDEPNFNSLIKDMRKRNAKVLAMYDDHDFLGNNRYGGEHDPELREVARSELVKAFQINTGSDDVYQLVSVGPVDIILLDGRFYRKSPIASMGSRDAILGPKQWEWFEKAFQQSKADFIVVASSTTLHTFGDESWEQYPGAFGRMRDLMRSRPGALIASGDVHRNALYDDSGVIEVVTSAVARNGIVFGSPRRNYGILTFAGQQANVQLRSLKAGWRFNVNLALDAWKLEAATDAAHTVEHSNIA